MGNAGERVKLKSRQFMNALTISANSRLCGLSWSEGAHRARVYTCHLNEGPRILFHTIAAVRQRIAIGYSRVLRKLANQGGKQGHFAGPPVSLREHSSAVGTDVFRNCPFPNPGSSKLAR